MSPFKSKRFLAEKAKWYRKLEKSGFEDAEDHRGVLKECHSFRFVSESPRENELHLSMENRFSGDRLKLEQRAEYYRVACKFLHSHSFDTKCEEDIWRLHAEGLPVREIVKKLGKRTSIYRDKVDSTIQRLRKIMLGR